MSTDRANLANKLMPSKDIPHQEALVQQLLKKKNHLKKFIVPGGKTLFDQVDMDTIENAIYTWLRSARSFSEVTLSFAKDPTKFRLEEKVGMEFDAYGPTPVWERAEFGRQYLAKQMADIIRGNKLVKMKVTSKGIAFWSDQDDKFAPKKKATKAEAKELGIEVGTEIPTVDWEPYLEFKLTGRPQYS